MLVHILLLALLGQIYYTTSSETLWLEPMDTLR